MKKLMITFGILVATGALFAASHTTEKPDSTTMRTELHINRNGHVDGVIRVLNPGSDSDEGFFVVVQLTVGDQYSEVLTSFDYPRDHPYNMTYPIHTVIPFDLTGHIVKIVAFDTETGHEFAGTIHQF